MIAGWVNYFSKQPSQMFDRVLNVLPKKVKEKLLFLVETVSPYTQDDILIVAETKIDASFPTAQFSAEWCHKPYRLDGCA